VNPEIVAAAVEKSKRDEIEMAELAHRGTPVAPIRTGADGGMHPVFQAALGQPRGVLDSEGNLRNIFDTKVPGTIPAHVNPPKPVDPNTGVVPGTPASGGYGLAAAGSKPVAAQPPPSGGPRVADSGNFFTRLFSSEGEKPAAQGPTGSVSNEKKGPPARPVPKQVASPKTPPAPGAPPATHADPKAAPTPQYAAAKPLPPAGEPPAKPSDAGLSASQPVGQGGNFDNRWGTGR
jgi:hypothetical protein